MKPTNTNTFIAFNKITFSHLTRHNNRITEREHVVYNKTQPDIAAARTHRHACRGGRGLPVLTVPSPQPPRDSGDRGTEGQSGIGRCVRAAAAAAAAAWLFLPDVPNTCRTHRGARRRPLKAHFTPFISTNFCSGL